MLPPIPPIAQKPPAARLGPDSHGDRRHTRDRLFAPPSVPDEVVTLSDTARQGLLGHARDPEGRSGRFGTRAEAAAAANRLEHWIRSDHTRAASAQAHASAERVWNLLWD